MSKNLLTNLALRNQVLLDRYKSAAVLEFDKVYKDLDKAISDTLGGLEVDTLDELAKRDLESLLAQLRVAQTDVGTTQVLKLTEELKQLGGFVAETEAAGLTGVAKAANTRARKATAATAKQAYAAAVAAPMNVGKESTGMLMESFMKGWSTATINMVNGAVLQGWQQGKTVQQVMQQIRGTKAALHKDGLITASRRDAAAMVRTATQHVANTARMDTWARNGDLVQGYEILATLDGRTTQICRSLDGRKYDLGKGPVPPFHVNCRTTTIPTLGDEFDFLDEGATRSSENGYVDANLTYYDWLKTQNPEFVKGALGASRAKLFLEGGLSAQEFGELNLGKNFEPLTLQEMAAARPSLFKATGLEQHIPEGIELLGDLPVAPVKVTTPPALGDLPEAARKHIEWLETKRHMGFEDFKNLLGDSLGTFQEKYGQDPLRYIDVKSWQEKDAVTKAARASLGTDKPIVTAQKAVAQRAPIRSLQAEWESGLTQTQKDSIEYWSETIETVIDVRTAENGGKARSPLAVEFLDTIKSAPRYSGTVYRGETNYEDPVGKLKPGDTFQFKHMTSTTKKLDVAEEFAGYGMDDYQVVYKIETRQGVDISRFVAQGYEEQEEVVVTRNTKFTIKSVTKDGEYTVVHLIDKAATVVLPKEAKGIGNALSKLRDGAALEVNGVGYKYIPTLEDYQGATSPARPITGSVAQQEAVEYYSNEGDRVINSGLRSGGELKGKGKTLANLIDKTPATGADMLTLRTVDSDTPFFDFKEGEILTEKGFLSTTPTTDSNFDPKSISSRYEVHIIVPKGSRGVANISMHSLEEEEAELLFSPGARFQVVKADKTGAVMRYLGKPELDVVRPTTAFFDVAPAVAKIAKASVTPKTDIPAARLFELAKGFGVPANLKNAYDTLPKSSTLRTPGEFGGQYKLALVLNASDEFFNNSIVNKGGQYSTKEALFLKAYRDTFYRSLTK